VLRFDAHHREGLVRLGDRFVLSTVEVTERYQPPGTIIDGTDRTAGKGIGHLIAFDAEGNLLADERLDDGADIYHPGGLDYDGRHLWVAIAEYRPNRPSIIYRVDPISLAATEVLRTPDHIGGIVHDTRRDRIVGLNWGSRTAYTWKLFGHGATLRRATLNPSHFVDYQDCKYLGRPLRFEHPAMLDDRDPAEVVADRLARRSGVDVQVVDGRLRLYLVADDDESDLLVYEAR
jgi:hypothetical protein